MNKKKTYKLQLPKGVNVDKTHFRIHDGQIVVDVEFKDIRWRADKDCTYYYVDERGNVLGCNDTRGCASDSRYSCGNYFKTREAARPYADQIKEIFKKSKAE